MAKAVKEYYYVWGMTEDIVRDIVGYHERTKHHPHHYASSPGYLDWENEPDLFRRYEGAEILELPFIKEDPGQDYSALYEAGKNIFHKFSLKNIAAFLELSMGLSAWKSFRGNSWPLRMNPSSGNLHPTETHLVLPPLAENGERGGIYHYNPLLHVLEERAPADNAPWPLIKKYFSQEGFFVALSSIFWREAWKYGERAFRYCNHDIGHALACLSFSGSLLGWKLTFLNALSDEDMEIILGFRKTKWRMFEKENAELLLFVRDCRSEDIARDLSPGIIGAFAPLSFAGEPNPLSNRHVEWAAIDAAAALTRKGRTPERREIFKAREYLENDLPFKAAEIIRRRRSGLAFDRGATLPRRHFFGMLDRTIPRESCAPFNLALGEVSVHLLVFVHRVDGLEPGIYFLVRNEEHLGEIKGKCLGSFLWEKVSGSVPLFLLAGGDFRSRAAAAGCLQEIAGDGVFSVAMIARFREIVEIAPYLYRHLHWEAGMVGQVLYLEAEAHSLRGTGMGCFFDDSIHQLLGFDDNTYQDLYHFAVGKPVEDERLTTLPAYHHLKRK